MLFDIQPYYCASDFMNDYTVNDPPWARPRSVCRKGHHNNPKIKTNKQKAREKKKGKKK